MSRFFPAALCVASAALSLAVATVPANAQNFSRSLPCEDTVSNRLADLGVERERIAGVLAEEDWRRGDEFDEFLGWIVWMKLERCDGQLVMRLSPSCMIATVYTTGNCRIQGVSGY